MRVLLINPSSPFLIDDKVFPPLGIGYIYASLKRAGIDVDFLDLAGGGSYEIDYGGYDIVGITMTTPQIAEAKLIAKQIKSTNSPPVVVAGGCGVMSLDDRSAFDIVFKGEGEVGFIDMINSTISKGECDGGMIGDIDSIPYPERSIFKDYHYEIDGHVTATMLTSRGCPMTCLTGDTLINTIHGKIPIKDIVEKYQTIPVYTYDQNKKEVFIVDAINIRKYGVNKEIVRVEFDDDTHIDCTPDHVFLTFKSGNQFGSTVDLEIQAKDLKPNMSVRAYSEEMSADKRVDIVWGRRKRKRRSRMVMEYTIGHKVGKKEYVHHVDKNPGNDNIDNLKLCLNAKEHFGYHPEVSERMKKDNPSKYSTEESREKIRIKITGLKRTPEQKQRYRESKLGPKNPMYGRKFSEEHLRKLREANKGENNAMFGKKRPDLSERNRLRKTQVNHKVKRVIKLTDRQDVYCMKVPATGWFFANNVLVHNCAFCTDGANKTVRRRSIDNIIGEIDDVRSRGYTGVMFFDDVFTINRDRVKVIGDYLMSKSMVYRCFTHVRVASRVAKTLADTNCREVGIGIESGDDNILRTIRKNFSIAEAKQAIKSLKTHGVRVKAFFMVGLPGETKESIQATRRFIAETMPDDIDVSVYVPFPGTDIYDNRVNYDLSWNGGNMNNFYKGKPGSYKVSTWTSKLNSDDILAARDSIEKEFKQWL